MSDDNLSNWEIMIMLIVVLFIIVVLAVVLCRKQNEYLSNCLQLLYPLISVFSPPTQRSRHSKRNRTRMREEVSGQWGGGFNVTKQLNFNFTGRKHSNINTNG